MKKLLFAVVAAVVAMSCCEAKESVELRFTRNDGTVTTEVRQLKRVCFEEYIRLELSTAELENIDKLCVTPSFARANEGEDGYFVAEDGLLYGFKHNGMGEYSRVAKNLRMSMSCINTLHGAYLAILKGLEFESIQRYHHKDGKYSFSYEYDLSDCGAYEPLVIDFYPMPKGEDNYSAMARRYREYLIESNQMPQMLKERVGENEHLKYASESPEIRIRQGWKPVPTPVEHQTLENEPEMRVAVTFDQVKDIVDELKRQGVEKAQLCLVGWNHKGHDGRYPTVFPVEPSLGGEEKLRECIKYAQDNGYRIVGHTNHTDIYEISSEPMLPKMPTALCKRIVHTRLVRCIISATSSRTTNISSATSLRLPSWDLGGWSMLMYSRLSSLMSVMTPPILALVARAQCMQTKCCRDCAICSVVVSRRAVATL